MVARIYYPGPEPTFADTSCSCEDRTHGFTLADIDRIARHAVSTAWAQASDYVGRYQSAWLAIAERLCMADEHPTRGDLVAAGHRGVNAEVADYHRLYGVSGGGDAARRAGFERFWFGAGVQPSHAGGIEDRLAVARIMSALSDSDRRVLEALAVTDDYRSAADLVGRSYQSFHTSLQRARGRFLALWHEGEQPSAPWGRDRRRWRQDTSEVADHRPALSRRRASWRRQASTAGVGA